MNEPTKPDPARAELKHKFPQWVLGDALDGRQFVIHLYWPRFVGEITQEYMKQEKAVCPVIELDFIDDVNGIDETTLFGLGAMAKDFYEEATRNES
jgi:hypothetical protein